MLLWAGCAYMFVAVCLSWCFCGSFGAYVKLQDVSVFLGMMDLCVCVEEGVFLWVWLYV